MSEILGTLGAVRSVQSNAKKKNHCAQPASEHQKMGYAQDKNNRKQQSLNEKTKSCARNRDESMSSTRVSLIAGQHYI